MHWLHPFKIQRVPISHIGWGMDFLCFCCETGCDSDILLPHNALNPSSCTVHLISIPNDPLTNYWINLHPMIFIIYIFRLLGKCFEKNMPKLSRTNIQTFEIGRKTVEHAHEKLTSIWYILHLKITRMEATMLFQSISFTLLLRIFLHSTFCGEFKSKKNIPCHIQLVSFFYWL